MRLTAAVLHHVRQTPVAYPITTVWAAGVTAAVGITQHWWDLGVALGLLSVVALLVFLVGLRIEVALVHDLLDVQRQALAKIDMLADHIAARDEQQGEDDLK